MQSDIAVPRVLVDTHALLWWMVGDPRLSRKAETILEDRFAARLVSVVSLWEIAIKLSLRRMPVHGLTIARLNEQLEAQSFIAVPIRLGDLSRLQTLPCIHRDPFDRLLIAQAAIQKYAVDTVW
jgi:PIN domain nuclease of toxin-antitoxin system